MTNDGNRDPRKTTKSLHVFVPSQVLRLLKMFDKQSLFLCTFLSPPLERHLSVRGCSFKN